MIARIHILYGYVYDVRTFLCGFWENVGVVKSAVGLRLGLEFSFLDLSGMGLARVHNLQKRHLSLSSDGFRSHSNAACSYVAF